MTETETETDNKNANNVAPKLEGTVKLAQTRSVGEYMNKLANNIIGMGEVDRDSNLWSSKGVGAYIVTKETMQDIMRGRELMSDTKVRDNQRLGTPKYVTEINSYNKI